MRYECPYHYVVDYYNRYHHEFHHVRDITIVVVPNANYVP